jgi:tetratricopeptide (TPR) repeat protein
MLTQDKQSFNDKLFSKTWLPYLIIISLGFILYAQVISFDFTYLDDQPLIVENYPFLSKLSNIFSAFTEDAFRAETDTYYRPVLTLSMMIDAQLGGISLGMYHFTNILIHLAAACLLFLFLLKLGYRKEPSLLLGLIFVAHPVLTQAVAWVPGRNDSLMAVFTLLTSIMFLEFMDKKSTKYYICHIALFAVALFTKESAILFLAPLLFYLHFIKKEKLFSITEIKLGAGWGAVIILWFLLRSIALANPDKITLFDLRFELLHNLPNGFLLYIGKALLPFNLTVLPTLGKTSIYGIITLLALIIILLTGKTKRLPYIIFGTLWFFIFLMLSFTFLAGEKLTTVALEHRIYLPLIGFVIVLMETDFIRNLSFKKSSSLFICICIVLLFSGLAIAHSNHYKNRIAFWENAVENNKDLPTIHRILSDMYYSERMLDKAEAELKETIKLNPKEPGANNSLGMIYMDKHMIKEAEESFKKEVSLNPNADKPLVNLGVVYFKEGRLKEAEEQWLKALSVNQMNIDVYRNLILLYMQQKDYPKAKQLVRRLEEKGVRVPQEVINALKDK